MECYGIDGRSITLAEAAKTSMFTSERQWVDVLLACAKAISQIHTKGYIHCDLKGDNIVINKVDKGFYPIVIDFGKMQKACEAKIKKLSTVEQEKYNKYHKHIAPEVVQGTHPPAKASDIYAFGLVISLICFYHKIENLRLIAVTCINGTPERRHTIDQIIDQLQSL
ncbi:probable serine threonine- kinase gdt4 [Paramuricea clavata]|uniref:Probable serine threonine- kinase gdt4 n=1 Tax=Paramuricea clavata TaxID=317549 RepID=A0A6S7KJA2_PARCT|nr:probable serine threonine- kinase gdt4 [Paramuricea clavata]